MVKKLLFLMTLGVSGFSTKAQVFSQDFESGDVPSTWTQTYINGATDWLATDLTGWPVENSDEFITAPSKVLLFNDDENGPDSVDATSITTPTISLSGYTSASLSFDYFNAVYQLPSSIKVEVFDGTAWQQVFFVDDNDFDIDDNIKLILSQKTIDITNYINSNFKIRFSYDDAGDWSYGGGFDNITVTGSLSNSVFGIQTKISVYPNPVMNEFKVDLGTNFDVANAKISIIDILGKSVASYKVVEGGSYDISKLQAGTYLVKISDGTMNSESKLIKR